jgi:hypothetical protein
LLALFLGWNVIGRWHGADIVTLLKVSIAPLMFGVALINLVFETSRKDDRTGKRQILAGGAIFLLLAGIVCFTNLSVPILEAAGRKKDEAIAAQHAFQAELQRKLDLERETSAQSRIEEKEERLRLEQAISARLIRFEQRAEAERTRREQRESAQSLQNLALRHEIAAAGRYAASVRTTLKGFERALNPIRDVRVAYAIELPLARPELAEYRDLLYRVAREFESAGGDVQKSPTIENVFTVRGRQRTYSRIYQIRRSGPAYPKETDSVIGCLMHQSIVVSFWQNPARLRRHVASPGLTGRKSYPDLRFVPVNPLGLGPLDTPILRFDVVRGRLWIYYPDSVPDPDYYMYTTHAIQAMPDLACASTYVEETGGFKTGNEAVDRTIDSVRPLCRLTQVRFTISGRRFEFDNSSMRYSSDWLHRSIATFLFRDTTDLSNRTRPGSLETIEKAARMTDW